MQVLYKLKEIIYRFLSIKYSTNDNNFTLTTQSCLMNI